MAVPQRVDSNLEIVLLEDVVDEAEETMAAGDALSPPPETPVGLFGRRDAAAE